MSTAYHLLDLHRKQQNQQHESPSPSLHVTVFDSKPLGTGGASAVAGGYVRLSFPLLVRAWLLLLHEAVATLRVCVAPGR